MAIRHKAAMLTRIAVVTGYAIREKLPNGSTPVHNIDEVPATADSVTTAWLTAALCRNHPAARVEHFELGRGSDGTSNRRAIRVDYNEAGLAARLPVFLWTKMTATLRTRLITGLANMGAGEARFYNLVRPHVDFGSPAGYHAAFDPASLRSISVMEDVGLTRNTTFGNTLQPVSRPEAESMVAQMAAYHGAFWDSSRLMGDLAELPTAEDFLLNMAQMINFEGQSLRGLRRCREFVPDSIVRRSAELWPGLIKSKALQRSLPRTVIHQDTHAGNWFRYGTNKMALHDWQGVARGSWATDLSYALSANLRPADRRLWESDLLKNYLDHLAAAGGARLGFDEAFLAYRREMLHGLFFWLFPGAGSRFQPSYQPHTEVVNHIHRTAQAAEDLDTLGAIAAG